MGSYLGLWPRSLAYVSVLEESMELNGIVNSSNCICTTSVAQHPLLWSQEVLSIRDVNSIVSMAVDSSVWFFIISETSWAGQIEFSTLGEEVLLFEKDLWNILSTFLKCVLIIRYYYRTSYFLYCFRNYISNYTH